MDRNIYIVDKKTGKANTLYLRPVEEDLKKYFAWLQEENINSDWLFPSIRHTDRHITKK